MCNLVNFLSSILDLSAFVRSAFNRFRPLHVLRADAILAPIQQSENVLHVYDLRLRVFNPSSSAAVVSSVRLRVLSPQGKWLWAEAMPASPIDTPGPLRKHYDPVSILDAEHTALPVCLQPSQESSILLRLPENIGRAICETHLDALYSSAADTAAAPTPHRRRRFSVANLQWPARSAAAVRPSNRSYPLDVCLQVNSRALSCRLQVVPHIWRPAAIR